MGSPVRSAAQLLPVRSLAPSQTRHRSPHARSRGFLLRIHSHSRMPPSPLNTKSPDHPPTGVAGDAVPDLPSCWQLLSLFPSLRRCFRREEGTVGGDRDDSDPGDRREFLGATAQAEPQGAGGPGGARRRRLLSGGKAGGAPVPRASLREDSYTPVGALARERGEKRHAPSRRAAFKFVV
ncbi:hypothetical protein NN561_011644 [Cricetulus griseus]